jgi:hypothetical protein
VDGLWSTPSVSTTSQGTCRRSSTVTSIRQPAPARPATPTDARRRCRHRRAARSSNVTRDHLDRLVCPGCHRTNSGLRRPRSSFKHHALAAVEHRELADPEVVLACWSWFPLRSRSHMAPSPTTGTTRSSRDGNLADDVLERLNAEGAPTTPAARRAKRRTTPPDRTRPLEQPRSLRSARPQPKRDPVVLAVVPGRRSRPCALASEDAHAAAGL